MPFIIVLVANSMIRETLLPNEPWSSSSEPIRKPTFDQWHGTFQGNLRRSCEQEMQMMGHDDKFVQRVFAVRDNAPLRPSSIQLVVNSGTEVCVAMSRCNEKRSIKTHPTMI
jgi:hypothetical protein